VFTYFGESVKCIKCAKSVTFEKLILKYSDVCDYAGDIVD